MIPIYLPNGTANPEKVLKFNGPPSAELDAAWERLLRCMLPITLLTKPRPTYILHADTTPDQTIRLTKEELGERGSEEGIVALPDGGYFGTITAYHSLHCVKRLHHFMYRDTYSPGLSAEESMRLQQHAGLSPHPSSFRRRTARAEPKILVHDANLSARRQQNTASTPYGRTSSAAQIPRSSRSNGARCMSPFFRLLRAKSAC
jgi:hypothetical protein